MRGILSPEDTDINLKFTTAVAGHTVLQLIQGTEISFFLFRFIFKCQYFLYESLILHSTNYEKYQDMTFGPFRCALEH